MWSYRQLMSMHWKITVSLELKPPKTKQNGLRSTDNMHHDVTLYFVVVFILIIEKKIYQWEYFHSTNVEKKLELL